MVQLRSLVLVLCVTLSETTRVDLSRLLKCSQNNWPRVDLWSHLLLIRRSFNQEAIVPNSLVKQNTTSVFGKGMWRFYMSTTSDSFD